MLDINPLSVISFANIFSHAVHHLFVLSMISFAVQKLLSLIRSHLSTFGFVSFALGDRSKKNIAAIYVKECSAYVFLEQFISLTFRSLIHFEFMSVYGVRECSTFIVLPVAVRFSQYHLLKRLSFLHFIFLPPLS